MLAVAPALHHRQHLGKAGVEQRIVDQVELSDKLGRSLPAAEALFKFIQTIGFIEDEHPAKVVYLRAVYKSQAKNISLKDVVRHQIALGV